jgi:hypothetical protein
MKNTHPIALLNTKNQQLVMAAAAVRGLVSVILIAVTIFPAVLTFVIPATPAMV